MFRTLSNAKIECQESACLVRMIWVKDQHAQAQHWLMHAQAQAQHWLIRLSIGSCMLRLRLSFRGSGGQLSPSMHDPMLSLSPSLSMHEPLLSLSMLVLDPNHPD